MEKLESAVKDQATKWGEVLLPILTKVASFLVKLATYILNHKVILIALAAVVGGIVVTAFVAWAASLWATVAAATVLGAPVLAVVAAIAAVIAIVVLLATHWKQIWHAITEALDAAWAFIKKVFGDVVHFFEKLPGQIIKALSGFGKMLLGWIKEAWDTLV
jgi:phage-related minor tail protein